MMSKEYIKARKPVFACTLKLGGDFIVEHVYYLQRQVREHTKGEFDFICFTDHHKSIPGVISLPLLRGWPGWWSKIELFRIVGPVVLMDLDTVIRGSLDGLFSLALRSIGCEFYMLSSFIPPRRSISGIMVYNGDWSWIYERFDFAFHSKKFRGDEDYINFQLKQQGVSKKFVQDEFPGIYSYKRDCIETGIPDDCSVLVFHGKPRPWHTPQVWNTITEAYK